MPHYIGCTRNIVARFKAHKKNTDSNKKKRAWVAELHKRGLQPQLRILAVFAQVEHAQECEQSRVDEGFAAGWPLANRRSTRSAHGKHTQHITSTEPGEHHGQVSHRQFEVLSFVDAFGARHGFGPTIRDIGKQLGIHSTNAVNDHLRALERSGAITRSEMVARSIVITKWGRLLLEKKVAA